MNRKHSKTFHHEYMHEQREKSLSFQKWESVRKRRAEQRRRTSNNISIKMIKYSARFHSTVGSATGADAITVCLLFSQGK